MVQCNFNYVCFRNLPRVGWSDKQDINFYYFKWRSSLQFKSLTFCCSMAWRDQISGLSPQWLWITAAKEPQLICAPGASDQWLSVTLASKHLEFFIARGFCLFSSPKSRKNYVQLRNSKLPHISTELLTIKSPVLAVPYLQTSTHIHPFGKCASSRVICTHLYWLKYTILETGASNF